MPTYELSLAPSVNALYANIGKKRRKTAEYAAWIRGELKALIAQRARPVETPVRISISLPTSMRGDASNRIKATEDLLVRAGVIPDDSKKHVASVSIDFAQITGMRVTVETI